MEAATVSRRSAHLGTRDCPIITGEAKESYRASVRAAAKLSAEIGEFLNGHDPKEQAAWLKASTDESKELFQPWSMEILYFVGVRGSVRFSEMEAVLGISSRTLSNKLKLLTEAGFLNRTLHDEHPVRIEYTLTKHGGRTAALAAPLFTHLNLTSVLGFEEARNF